MKPTDEITKLSICCLYAFSVYCYGNIRNQYYSLFVKYFFVVVVNDEDFCSESEGIRESVEVVIKVEELFDFLHSILRRTSIFQLFTLYQDNMVLKIYLIKLVYNNSIIVALWKYYGLCFRTWISKNIQFGSESFIFIQNYTGFG